MSPQPSSPISERKRVYFTMVLHPAGGWTRVGNAYGSRKSAQGWVPFVRKSWRGLRTRVSQCTLHLIDGKLDARSVKILDRKFNMDAPA